jgi:hypothetical protein
MPRPKRSASPLPQISITEQTKDLVALYALNRHKYPADWHPTQVIINELCAGL